MSAFTESVVENARAPESGPPTRGSGRDPWHRRRNRASAAGLLGKTIAKTIGKTPEAVLRLLAEDPSLSAPQLAEQLEKSVPTVHRAIRTLRESGRLVRVGSAKGGRWQVIE